MMKKAFYWLLGRMPVRKRKILFVSHLGKGYGCNPKYICEYILNNHSKEYTLHWVYDPVYTDGSDIPSGVKPVSLYSKWFRYDILTCGLIISNTRLPKWFGFKKRKGQRYLQTWHSSLRLKKIEGDANLDAVYQETAKEDSGKTDAIISGCRFSTETIKRAFWYNGPILEVGTPRIDFLLNQNQESRKLLLYKAGLDSTCHYLLYAPTFRNGNSVEAYDIDFDYLSNTMKRCFGGEWIILCRLHPNLRGKVGTFFKSLKCLDMTDYPDMQELLVISDVLITDFSSCMFDMAFMQKICILYASDLEQYLRSERDLYFQISSLPFPLAKTNDELCEIVQSFDMKEYKEKIVSFLDNIGSFETGNAINMIYNYIKQY